jgi:hypothetical protein
VSKQELEKQLERAYTALSNAKDRKAQAGDPVQSNTERVLQQHIRYLKQLIREAS